MGESEVDQKQTYFNIGKLTEMVREEIAKGKGLPQEVTATLQVITNLAIAQQLSVVSSRLDKLVKIWTTANAEANNTTNNSDNAGGDAGRTEGKKDDDYWEEFTG